MRDQVAQLRELGVAAAALNSANDAERDAARSATRLRDGELRLLYRLARAAAARRTRSTLLRARRRRPARHRRGALRLAMGPRFPARISAARARRAQALGGVPDHRADRDRRRADPRRHRRAAVRRAAAHLRALLRPAEPLSRLRGRRTNRDAPARRVPRARIAGESGIVYCASRKRTEELARDSRGKRRRRAALSRRPRPGACATRNQDAFLQEDGVVIVRDHRLRHGHRQARRALRLSTPTCPASIESYYQEIGRAGRDGLPADTLTLYGLGDMELRRRQIDESDAPDGAQAHRAGASSTTLSRSANARAAAARRCSACFGEDGGALRPLRRLQGRACGSSTARSTAQKALSAVLRTRARFFFGHLANILAGKATDAVRATATTS